MGDTTYESNTSKVKELGGENFWLKETVAKLLLQNRVIKKSTNGKGKMDEVHTIYPTEEIRGHKACGEI